MSGDVILVKVRLARLRQHGKPTRERPLCGFAVVLVELAVPNDAVQQPALLAPIGRDAMSVSTVDGSQDGGMPIPWRVSVFSWPVGLAGVRAPLRDGSMS